MISYTIDAKTGTQEEYLLTPEKPKQVYGFFQTTPKNTQTQVGTQTHVPVYNHSEYFGDI